MKTRTLLLLALGAGLAILLAGGVLLFNLNRNKASVTLTGVLHAGDTARVGEASVVVEGIDRQPSTWVVTVRITAGATPIADAGQGWALLAGGSSLRARMTVPAGDPADCAGLAIAAGTATRCRVAFAPGLGAANVSYELGAKHATWQLS